METNKKQIKNQIESETGLKVSVKRNGLNGSMRGYLTFTAKKQNGEYPEWNYEYGRKLAKQFEAAESHPTFCSNYQLSVYIGDEIYN